MDYFLTFLRLVLVYALLCLGVEIYTTLFQFKPAMKIANQAITENNFNMADRCLAAADDSIRANPFNLPGAIRQASHDFLKKEGCK